MNTAPPLAWLIDYARALGRDTTADLTDFDRRAARLLYANGENAKRAADRAAINRDDGLVPFGYGWRTT